MKSTIHIALGLIFSASLAGCVAEPVDSDDLASLEESDDTPDVDTEAYSVPIKTSTCQEIVSGCMSNCDKDYCQKGQLPCKLDGSDPLCSPNCKLSCELQCCI